jgi:hypothetical protein
MGRGGAGYGCGRLGLLATSSVAALLIGGGLPTAQAAVPCTPNFFQNTSVASVTNSSPNSCIYVVTSTVTGNVTNTSTLTPAGTAYPSTNGITIDNSTVGGAIINQGTITNTLNGVSVTVIFVTNNALVGGGVTNSGTITLSNEIADRSNGIRVSGVSVFSGGVSNTDLIHVVGDITAVGVNIDNVSTFNGGINNSGTISTTSSGDGSYGIYLENVGNFAGSIINSAGGVITASANSANCADGGR